MVMPFAQSAPCCLVVLVTSLAIGPSAWAQSAQCVVAAGVVKDTQGEIVPNVTVVMSIAGAELDSFETNSEGVFMLAYIPQKDRDVIGLPVTIFLQCEGD